MALNGHLFIVYMILFAEFEGWDNSDWGWQDDEEVHKAQHSASGTADVTWLHDCHLSLSPAADLMAVGKGDRLVLLAREWK